MKKIIKTNPLFILLLIVVSLPKTYAQTTVTANAGFVSVLDKIFNDYPNNFNNLKGEKYDRYIVGKEWWSTENLPGYEKAFIDSGDQFHGKITIKLVLIELKTLDSTEALNKYHELVEKINQSKFECCGFKHEEHVNYELRPKSRMSTWSVDSVNPGKVAKYTDMKMELNFMYPLIGSEYTLSFSVLRDIYH